MSLPNPGFQRGRSPCERPQPHEHPGDNGQHGIAKSVAPEDSHPAKPLGPGSDKIIPGHDRDQAVSGQQKNTAQLGQGECGHGQGCTPGDLCHQFVPVNGMEKGLKDAFIQQRPHPGRVLEENACF